MNRSFGNSVWHLALLTPNLLLFNWIQMCRIVRLDSGHRWNSCQWETSYLLTCPLPGSDLISWTQGRNLQMKLFPVQWDVNIPNNDEKWRHQEPFIPPLPRQKPIQALALIPPVLDPAQLQWQGSFQLSYRISRGDGPSPLPIMVRPALTL